MRRAALLLCSVGCYPSSDLALPPGEGYLSRIILGSGDQPAFAHASATDAISAFTAGNDLTLEALLYQETLAELGLTEGAIPIGDSGRRPPIADAVRRTTIAGGEFSGWDSVESSELAGEVWIPHFDPSACAGCTARDEHGDPICRLDCMIPDPTEAQLPASLTLASIDIPPDCPPGQIAYPGEQCHTFGACPADGWPAATVDAYVQPGAAGVGTQSSPFGTVGEALASGATRIALSAGTHTFDGFLQVPVELYGACAEETIIETILRMREDLILHDVTVIGGIETCRAAEIRRVHVHGRPLLGERANITASDLALHDSYAVLIDSRASFERLFISGELPSFTCQTSDVDIAGAFFVNSTSHTLGVGGGCTVALRGAVLRPALSGALVDLDGHLSLDRARIDGVEGGIHVVGTASISELSMRGDEGLEIEASGEVHVARSIIESTDLDSGAAIINLGRVVGERLALSGAKRGVNNSGIAELSDVSVTGEAYGILTNVESELILRRALINARVKCVEAQVEFEAYDLTMAGCEIGLSSSETAHVERMRAVSVGTGVAHFAGMLTLREVYLGTALDAVDVSSGEVEIEGFVIERASRGVILRSGSLMLERGRLKNLEIGLKLPEELRPEEVMNEVSLEGVSRVFEASD